MSIVNKYNIDINSMTDKKTTIKDIMSDKKFYHTINKKYHKRL